MIDNTTTLSPVPRPEYWPLDAFVGKWRTTGNMVAGEGQRDHKIIGADTYEWLPGGFFMMHKVDVSIGAERVQTTEIIGYDDSTNNYMMHFFDNKGQSGLTYASIRDGIWTFASDTMKFTGRFSDDGRVMSGVWQQAREGSWEFLMNIKLTKE